MTKAAERRRKPLKPSIASLSGLGAERLAELLLAAAKTDTGLKRALTLEIARDGSELAEEIDEQVQRLRTARGRVTALRAVVLGRELTRLRDAITEKLGPEDPGAAVIHLLDFLSLAPTILARRTGEGRPVTEAFSEVEAAIAALVPQVSPGAARLSLIQPIVQGFVSDQHGLAGRIIGVVSNGFDADEREALRLAVDAQLRIAEQSRAGGQGATHQINLLTAALGQVADASGDVEAFAQVQRRRDTRFRDHVAVASRLLAAGRAEEALAQLEASALDTASKELRIRAFEVLGQSKLAQAERWALFRSDLSIDALRSYLRRLPDFDNVEREQEALALVEQHADATAALSFLVRWPDHRRAGSLAGVRLPDLNGSAEAILAPVAGTLAHKDPLAATLVLRRLIDVNFRLGGAGSASRAAGYFVHCASLGGHIADREGRPDHGAYRNHLRNAHLRKAAFWRRAAD